MTTPPTTEPRPAPEPAAEVARPKHTVLDLLDKTTQLFRKNKIDSPRLEAEMLLAHILGVPRIQLYVRFDQPVSPAEVDAYRALVQRRGRFEPVHYILGHREFWSLDLAVEKGVLIPRPDTECLVEEAVALAPKVLRADAPLLLADLGTGSGAVAIALATELEHARIFAGDLAEIPIRVAGANAKKHGVQDRVSLVHGQGLLPLVQAAGSTFDLIVSNPPYITEAEFPELELHIRGWEPREALVAGPDGLDVYRAIAAELTQALRVGGALALEIGDKQSASVSALFAPRFDAIKVRNDYAGLPRVVVASGFRG
ncbi:MAG: peptide chain release factor N(5)-glutamine methyltransferase [Deltaproteobacteria bacterium]|nr:peptide chain release factor N(5)-glutamine methyltransferase [Deltaproteobacteria bacterium]